MAKKLSKPNDRGQYPCEKGGHKFYLGTERQEAERRKGVIESILASVGGAWDCMSKTVALAVARGDRTLTVDLLDVAFLDKFLAEVGQVVGFLEFDEVCELFLSIRRQEGNEVLAHASASLVSAMLPAELADANIGG
jgi:hypothetical protein